MLYGAPEVPRQEREPVGRVIHYVILSFALQYSIFLFTFKSLNIIALIYLELLFV
jgi:hypothetical protein